MTKETESPDPMRRRQTLETLVDLFEGASESSCYGPDRAERLLQHQTTPDELRDLGVGESIIARLFGESAMTEPDAVPTRRSEEHSVRKRSSHRRASFSVRVEARFEAAHFLRSYRGITEPLHGHSYKVEAELERSGGALDEDELAVDFVESRAELQKIASRLDYTCINEVAPFDELNPTAENVAKWFQEQLQEAMGESGAVVTEVRLHEGPVNSVTYRPGR